MKSISEHILSWYHTHKRDLPWRYTKNPYLIWLSEIILQQTKVSQGTPYFIQFSTKYPSIYDLAFSSEDDVMKTWQGLGYYSRARNLHKTAKIITEQYSGHFPDSYKELLKLPGIGEYTAAAISSIAFDQSIPVLDGNIYRVISRLFGVTLEIGTTSVKKYFIGHAANLLGDLPPGDFNQAMMEFGALQCTPKNPSCDICPVKNKCSAFANDNVHLLPVTKKRNPLKDRYFTYYVFHDATHTIVHRRANDDIWGGLYEFPKKEHSKLLNYNNLKHGDDEMEVVDLRHILTHQRLFIRFIIIRQQILQKLEGSQQLIQLKKFDTLAIPKPIVLLSQKSLIWKSLIS